MDMDSVDYFVYFDGKQNGGYIALACAIFTSEKSNVPVATKTESAEYDMDNQFTIVLKALSTAVKCLKENGIRGNVLIMHQNNTVMNWLLSGRANDTYRELYAEVKQQMSTLQFECKFFLKPIKPEENKAKKLCKHVKAPSNSGLMRLVFDTEDECQEDTEYQYNNVFRLRDAR